MYTVAALIQNQSMETIKESIDTGLRKKSVGIILLQQNIVFAQLGVVSDPFVTPRIIDSQAPLSMGFSR